MKVRCLFAFCLLALFRLPPAALAADQPNFQETVLVRAKQVSSAAAAVWKKEGFSAAALLMDEQLPADAITNAAVTVAKSGLKPFGWIEVGFNPGLANEHPEWVASVGMHEDWLKRFPRERPAATNEVFKAFPWVPIFYEAAFQAHLKRIETILAKTTAASIETWFISNLQGGPSSCGCGNLQCRWAADYGVPATAAALDRDTAAGLLLKELKTRYPTQHFIPVWTTECEEQDLPLNRAPGRVSSGLCGAVPCAHGACPKEIAKQWSSLVQETRGPIALLALSHEFERHNQKNPAPGAIWPRHVFDYALGTPLSQPELKIPQNRLWLVVRGNSKEEEKAFRELSRKIGAGGVVAAQFELPQTFEPRIFNLQTKRWKE